MSKKAVVNIVVVPVSGAVSYKEITVDSNMSLAEILEQSGISLKGMKVTVDGNPVKNLEQPVNKTVVIVEKVREVIREVVVTEQVSGS